MKKRKIEKMLKSGRSGENRWLWILLLAVFSLSTEKALAGQWTFNTSLQFSTGNYIYATTTNAYYLYGGLAYRSNRWSISFSVPLILQNTDLVSQTGGMFLPTGEKHHRGEESTNWMHGGRMRPRITEVTHYEWGIGDTYFSGEYALIPEGNNLPSVSVNTQLKVPTANRDKNFGTGELDWSLGVSFRKIWHSYVIFADAGYLNIGDPVGVTYQNPIYEGLGIGSFLMNRNLSILVYFQNFSRILKEYDPPRQVSIGAYLKGSSRQLFSLNVTFGLSETSPDLLLSGGISWQL